MSSGIVCKCGTELDLSDVFCRSCGAKKVFKVDPRITDEAWVEWRKYQKENPEAASDSSRVEPSPIEAHGSASYTPQKPSRQSRKEVEQEYRDRNEVKRPKVHKAYKWWKFRRLLRNYILFLLVVAIGYFAFTNAKTITSFVESSLDKLLSSASAVTPTVVTSAQVTEAPITQVSNSVITKGKPLDLYLTWPVDCALPFEEFDFGSLNCSSTYSESNWEGNWWDDPAIRKEICASAYTVFYDYWPRPIHYQKEVPSDTNIYVFDAYSANPLMAANLVGIPEFKKATLVTEPLNGADIEGYELSSEDAKTRSYGRGFCVVHFQVQSMPDYQGSITVSLDSDPNAPGTTTWLLDGNEPSSRQFLFPGGEWMADWEQIWDQNDYGSNPEVYLP